MNVQARMNFLQNAVNEKVKVFLFNGIMLNGVLTDFDEFYIVLDNKCLVEKEKIISIVLDK